LVLENSKKVPASSDPLIATAAERVPGGVPTEAKRGEEALIASELRYRRLFETAKDGILILDADTGMVVDVNPFLIDKLGFSRE